MLKKINKKNVIESLIFIAGFLFFFSLNVSDNSLGYDKIWTFHMSQKILLGEIPYSEINIIITPLFYQLSALFFLITGQPNLVAYSLLGGLLGACVTLLIYKIMCETTENKMVSMFSTCMIVDIMRIVSVTSYNLLLYAFILLVLLLELKKENGTKPTKYNIIIGFVLGLCAATKHTIGGIAILASLSWPIIRKFACKEDKISFKEISQKLIGVFVIGVGYLIWLLAVGALDEFIDLAILSIGEFAEKNSVGGFYNLLTLISAAIVYACFILFENIKKEEKKAKQYLLLGVFSLVNITYLIPLCNCYHVVFSSLLAILTGFIIFSNLFKHSPKITMIIILVFYCIIQFFVIPSLSVAEIVESVKTRWSDFKTILEIFKIFVIVLLCFFICGEKFKINIYITWLGLIIIPTILNIYMWQVNLKENNTYYIPEYSCIGLPNDEMKDILEVNEYILQKEQDGYKVLIPDIEASRYMVPLHKNNYKYDLLLDGNLGYNGEKRILNELKNMKKTIILRQKPEVEKISIQQPLKIDEFIEKNYECIGEINNLEIYLVY